MEGSVEILIVEDAPTQAEVLEYLLQEAGYVVRTAGDGQKALAMARERRPAVVISDVVMPGMDGYTLCSTIKSEPNLRDIPVLLVTALAGAEEILRALRCGADNFVRKPYQASSLLQLIEHALTNRELQKSGKAPQDAAITLEGTRHVITSDRQQILDLLQSTFLDAIQLNADLQQREKELGRSLQALHGLYGVAEALNHSTYEQDVLDNALKHALRLPEVRAGWVSLREGRTGFRVAASAGLPPALQCADALSGDCLCRRKLLAGELDQTVKILECERLRQAQGDTQGLRYHACVPLWNGHEVMGVMNLAGAGQGLFAASDLPILYSVGNLVAVGLERASLLQQMERKVAERTANLTAEIAERKKAERARERVLQQLLQMNQELAAVKDRLQLQISQMPIGCIVWDTDFCVQSWNPAAEKLFGFTEEEALGKRAYDFIVPADVHPQVESVWARLREADVTVQNVNENIRKDGRRIQCDWANIPLRNSDGSVIGVLCMVQDVTERQQLQLQLSQSQKMEAVGRLAGGVAHDFNNHLGVIIGYSDLLLDRLPPGDPLRKSATMIKEAGQRSASLTRQLLAFSRRQVFEPKVLDLNVVVSDLDRMLRPLIGEDVELVTLLDPSLGKVRADPSQLDQIIMNLAVNARDAMPQGGRLVLQTSNAELDGTYASRHAAVRPGTFVMLSVSDNGIGMDKQTQEHIFEPFFTTKEKGRGTGLGLSMVYGIVKQSGGYIWVYSELEKGTTFKIYLPRVDEDVSRVTAEPVSNLAGRGDEIVLVVEDEGVLRELSCEFLRENGYTVLQAASGAEAMEVSSRHRGPIHLLMTDAVMPGISGRELAQTLERHRPDMKVLFVSGYTDDSVLRNGLLDPYAAFLQKPFSRNALTRKIRAVLDGGEGSANGH